MKQKQTRKKGSRILFRILFVAALLVFLWSGYHLLKELKRYHDGEQEYDSLANAAKIPVTVSDEKEPASVSGQPDEPETSSSSAVPEQPGYDIDFDYLSSVNSDVIGWISIPNTRVDYPIVQTDDNDYYLHYSFKGQYDNIGCPFADYRVSGDFRSRVTYIYGHDLNNGAMFPDIKKYRDASFQRENPYFYIFTPERTLVYQVFSAHSAHKTDGDAFQTDFADDTDFLNYVSYIRSLTYYETTVSVTAADRVVSLVTCEEDREHRFVVNGVLVQEIEK